MFTSKQKTELTNAANNSLNIAEDIWDKVGDQLIKGANEQRNFSLEAMDSQIPGHPSVDIGNPKVDNFIAIVADMRKSTEHLMCRISPKTAKVTQLQRVFYETAALLPSLAKAIRLEGGNVTEYLGDGVLGLFCLGEEVDKQKIYAANRAAKKCIAATKEIVNPILDDRYSLPNLDIGVGMAYSKAVVTLVGLPDSMQPKVFGECVFRATKLSSGSNTIVIDEALEHLWPTSKTGTISFLKKEIKGVTGFEIQNK